MDKQIKVLSAALQERGHRLTAARQLILAVLVQCGGHISADGLAERVREQAPNVGRMTVYRTLDLLSEAGLIRPVYQGTGAAHYILLEDGHHHHLICSNCAQVQEVADCGLEALEALLSQRFDFQIQGHLVEFYGLCAACRVP
jgi:Fur family ferric uptake transcriptional regulator